MNEIIGRVAATEKFPATMDKFYFWTDADFRLNAFDVVKVAHLDGSHTFGTVENIFHITDAKSFLTNYISCDFGDTTIDAPTLRIGMNYVEVAVSFNTKNIYTPVKNDSPVTLADAAEIQAALGLDKIKNKLPCGFLRMYEGHASQEIFLPVNLDAKFLLGPEGAHLNISGISGLAAKTSYAMFLMKSVQENFPDCAFIVFNVKGKDLLALHTPGDAADAKIYESLGLSGAPFENVRYYAPRHYDNQKVTSYLPPTDAKKYLADGLMKRFTYVYREDRESLELLFADIDDSTQTMDSIISKIIDANDYDFGGISTWQNFLFKVSELAQKGNAGGSKEISVLSWRKFKRIVNKAIRNDAMFVDLTATAEHECRLADELKKISAGSVSVIDIAKLASDKQAFVFGDVLKTIYNLKLGEYEDFTPPSKIVIFRRAE